MPRISLASRLLAFGASVAMTFAVVTLIANYGLPNDSGTQLLVRAAASASVR